MLQFVFVASVKCVVYRLFLVCLCISVSKSVCQFVLNCVYVLVCISMCVFQCVFQFVSVRVFASVCASMCVSVYYWKIASVSL